MLNNKNTELKKISDLAKAYGWRDLGPQKNYWMMSFMHDETGARINVYHTTGTVTLQLEGMRSMAKTWKNVKTMSEYETIFA